ncbi:hypothetical protein GCM10022199_26950 [Marihabitans asiaticum]|uniref:Glycosyltransferase involved in cell wall biosynthesis n=1 Tax=Marihabitans asiaticum TaxID=415218 RepID=A0A560WCY5_9MICO|nr:glycosyltransferase [Marihabitans asiaticum]TWD15507.1 glycosyltransferase involved in cell wall biosynthesis [Marihabitans asiaticum]
MKVIQIVPSVGRGSGVESVAYHLEQEWQQLGVETLRFTMADARGDWLPAAGKGAAGKIALLMRVVWFSTVGTLLARHMLRQHPDAVSVCHNDVMAGDVYVNHGIIHVALAAQGRRWWRTIRNPIHAFTGVRDTIRYASRRFHRVVINLVATEESDLRATYPRMRVPSRVIGNGVDTDTYRPPTVNERTAARAAAGIPAEDFTILFVGHEFERKGLSQLVEAVAAGPPEWHLVVVGGDDGLLDRLRATTAAGSLAERLHLVGPVADPTSFLHAADVLATPSSYESYGLVVLEAMACGLPVVATPTGCAADLVLDGATGWLCTQEPSSIRAALQRVANADRRRMREAARAVAMRHSWRSIAQRYLQLFEELHEGESQTSRTHIAHVIRSTGFAGVERHVATLAGAQAQLGHRVSVIGGRAEDMRTSLPARVRFRPAATVAGAAWQLARLVITDRPSVVHTHMSAAELAASMIPLRGAPIVSTRHFAARRGARGPHRALLAIVAKRICSEVAVSEYIARHVAGDTWVVHPGVTTRPEGRAAHDRERTVLVAQRLEIEKSTDTALEAFAASGLPKEGWRLQIAGGGSQRGTLEDLAARLEIADATDFLGHRTDVDQLMSDAAIFLAPCAVEGLGMSVLEAMSNGLPVVAAAAGGHLESVGGTEGAALFPPGDPAAAGQLLRELASEADRRHAYGLALRRRQRMHFSPTAQAEQMDAVYAHARAAHVRTDGPDLVIVSLEPWDRIWRRNQHLISGLLRRDPSLTVLFVEPAVDLLHALRSGNAPRRGAGLRRGPRVEGVDPGALWLYQPTKSLPRLLDPQQDQRWARSVVRAASRIGITEPTLWVNDPQGAELLDLSEWPALYDITDDWLEADRDAATHARLVRQERTLMDRARQVVVCSKGLQQSKGTTRPVVLVRNAVDVPAYRAPAPRPQDLPSRPVALYLGTLHSDRLDISLCVDTARRLPPGRLVLVGPDALTSAQRRRLDDAGVALLGPKDHREVPGYLQHADVLVVPHVVDAFTDSLDPIKLYEYRAVGRPIVTTPVAGFREVRGTAITVVNRSDFANMVAAVLASATHDLPSGQDDIQDDIPSWAERVDEMATVIANVQESPTRLGTLRDVPLSVRLEMAHHVVQHVAETHGIDILHIKGLALDDSLQYPGRTPTDVDVLARPDDADALVGALQGVGFELLGRFATSSPFEHSATLRHDQWGDVDVHRLFPGIGPTPKESFDLLWERRNTVLLGGRECAVPPLAAQALMLVLHAARSRLGAQPRNDLMHVVHHPDPHLRPALLDLADELHAEVAIAAATGRLHEHTGHPDHNLWHAVSVGDSRLDEWRARIAAAPDLRTRLSVLLRAPTVNTDHLAMLLGRRPTGVEVAAEFGRRSAAGFRELTARIIRRGRS